jgi:hypothetical protein
MMRKKSGASNFRSFGERGFYPISWVFDPNERHGGPPLPCISIPPSVIERMRLSEGTQIVWRGYSKDRIILEVRRA